MKVKFLLSGTIALCMFAFGPYANAMFGVGGGNNDIPKPDIPPHVLEHVYRTGFPTAAKAEAYSNKMHREGLFCTVSPNTPYRGNPNAPGVPIVPPPVTCNVYVEQWT